MTNINIPATNKPLINFAIKLTEWLLSLPEVKIIEGEMIEQIQQTLKHLPKVRDPILTIIAFSIEQGD